MLNNVGHRLNSHLMGIPPLMDTFLSCQLMTSFISYVLHYKELYFLIKMSSGIGNILS